MNVQGHHPGCISYKQSSLCTFQTFEDIDLFHLIGVICGLAIYNLTIVELHFPVALYKKLLKRNPTLEDLKELMPDVGRSAQWSITSVFLLLQYLCECTYGPTKNINHISHCNIAIAMFFFFFLNGYF